MKKALLLGLSVLMLSACIPQKTENPTPKNEQQAAGEFAKVGVAIQAGQSARCVMTKTDEGGVMNYALKGEKMKITGMGADEAVGQSGSMLSDGEYIYTWDDVKKTGVKIKVLSGEELQDISDQYAQGMPDFSKVEDQQKYEGMGYSVKCSVEDVPDSEFVPPADVKFIDPSAMMENAKKMMPANPEGMTAAEQEKLKKQAEEMMKQYQQ